MAIYLPRRHTISYDRAPPIVQPGQTLPKLDLSRIAMPLIVREESDVTVSVHVTGTPPPKVTWYIGESTLSPSVEYQMKQKGNTHSLTILNASPELEEGLYVAATNVVGRVKKKIEIKLYKVLSKHKQRPRRSWHSYRSTGGVRRRPKTSEAPQRHKSFGSFGQFDTLIDGDPSDEVVEDLDEKLYATLCHYKSTPNIRGLASTEGARDRRVDRPSERQYTERCRTLPSLNVDLTAPGRRHLAKSTEAIHNELTLVNIPALEMDFDVFRPNGSGSAEVTQSPLRTEEGDVSLSSESDFYRQYNRNSQRSVSTFLPPEAEEERRQAKPGASSFDGRSRGADDKIWDIGGAKLTSFVRQSLDEYRPDDARYPAEATYALGQEENVLAGNLTQRSSSDRPKIAPKPKVKKSKKTKDKVDSSAAPGEGGVQPGSPTYENIGSLQLQASDGQLEGGFIPDHNSSAILYAPDGTTFKLPMTGEYDPSLVLGARQDKDNSANVSQHSFAIMPNESISLSPGTQPATLSVFSDDVAGDKPKKKTGKKVKKPKSTTGDSVPAEPTGLSTDQTTGSQSRYTSDVHHGYRSQVVYENLDMDYRSRGHQDAAGGERMRGSYGSLDSSGRCAQSANASVESGYPRGSASSYDFDPEHCSSSIASGASVPVTPTSAGSRTGFDGASSEHAYYPLGAAGDSGENVRRPGGRRPTQPPPPPPPTSGFGSPPPTEAEMSPLSPTKPSQFSQQLTIAPASPDPIRVADLGDAIPSSAGAGTPTEHGSVRLDYSVPMDVTDPVSAAKVRKSSHRKADDSAQISDGSSLPKKPKVAKKPKHLKQKLLATEEPASYHLQQDQPQLFMPTQPASFQQVPEETNIDDVASPVSPYDVNISTSYIKKIKRSKPRSRSKDYADHGDPVGEIWIDKMPDYAETNLDAPSQQQEVSQAPFTSADIADASTPKMVKKKKVSRKASDETAGTSQHRLQAVEIDFDSGAAASGAPGSTFQETCIDAPPADVIMQEQAPIERVKRVVKKKKKVTKSVGDLSGFVESSLQPAPPEGAVNEQIVDPSGDPEDRKKKIVKKKKKLNKSTGDINADLTTELVEIGEQMTECKKKKKKVKEHLTKSVGDLSQTLPTAGLDHDVTADSFCDTQTLERPKKKVKKVKKKTKSMGDLTGGETAGMSLVDIDIDSKQNELASAEEPPKQQATEGSGKEVRKKKKKSVKSVSTGELPLPRETCIDDVPTERAEVPKVQAVAPRETCIDDVFTKGPDIAPVTATFPQETCIDDVFTNESHVPVVQDNIPHETCIDDVFAGSDYVPKVQTSIPLETCIDDDVLMSTAEGEGNQGSLPQETCIDDVLPEVTDRQKRPIGTSQEAYVDYVLPEPEKPEVYAADFSETQPGLGQSEAAQAVPDHSVPYRSVLYQNLPCDKQLVLDEQMDVLPASCAQTVDNSSAPQLETDIDVGFDAAMVQERLPPRQEAFTAERTEPCAKETLIDDIFDGSHITPKKKTKKRSKSSERRKQLSGEAPPLETQVSLDTGKTQDSVKKIKKKKKMTKSTGDLTDFGCTAVDIDIDKPPSMSEDLLAVSGDKEEGTKKVKRVKKKISSKGQEIDGTQMEPAEGIPEERKKKIKKVVKKKLHKSTGDLNVVATPLVVGQDIYIDGSVVDTIPPGSDITNTEMSQPAEKKKKKVVKKKIPKDSTAVQETNVDEPLPSVDAQISGHVPGVIQAETIPPSVDNEKPGDNSLYYTPPYVQDEDVIMSTAPTNVVSEDLQVEDELKPREKKKKKVTKKSKMKSTSDLTEMSGMEVAFIQDVGIDNMPPNMTASLEPLDVLPTEPSEKKTKKVVKKKKLNKSFGDLSQFQSQPVEMTKEMDIVTLVDDNMNISAELPKDMTSEVVEKKKRVVKKKKKKSVSDQTVDTTTAINITSGDVQQVEDGSQMPDNVRVVEEAMDTMPSGKMEDLQRGPDFNTEHLPKETDVSDIFLDQQTMMTVLDDVLISSTSEQAVLKPDDEISSESKHPCMVVSDTLNTADEYLREAGDHSTEVVMTTATVFVDDQAVENLETAQKETEGKKKKKTTKKKKITKSTTDLSQDAAIDGVPTAISEETAPPEEDKKKRKNKKLNRSLGDLPGYVTEQVLTSLDSSDIPMIDSEESENSQEKLVTKKAKKPKKKSPEKETVSPPEPTREILAERNLNVVNTKEIGSAVLPKQDDMRTIKTDDVLGPKRADRELNNNTAERGTRIQDGVDWNRPVLVSDGAPDVKLLPAKTDAIEERDDVTVTVDKPKKEPDVTGQLPYSTAQFRSFATISIKKPEAEAKPMAAPVQDAQKAPESIPITIHRKKDYPPATYRPWTDILFGSTEAKVPKKEPASEQRSLDRSFTDSSVDSQLLRLDDDRMSYSSGRSEKSLKSQTRDSRPGLKEPVERVAKGETLERKPSLRQEARSLDNLLDVDETSHAYNKYDGDDDEEERRSRIRTKSVDNLTLLQQRQRQASKERTMEHREHSKSTGCLLEGRIARLARKTLTQELVYETVTTEEEVVIIKRPLKGFSVKREPEKVKPEVAKGDISKKERRYLGSLVIVDIYDDKDIADQPQEELSNVSEQLDTSDSRHDTSIEASLEAIITDYRKGADVGRTTTEHEVDVRSTDDDVASGPRSTATSSDRHLVTDNSERDSSSSLTSVSMTETTVKTAVRDTREDDKPAVMAVEVKEMPVALSPVHLETVRTSPVHQAKADFQIQQTSTTIVNETYTVQREAMPSRDHPEGSKDEGVQVNLEELLSQPTEEPQSTVKCETESEDQTDSDEGDSEDESMTETDGESGESYEPANDTWQSEAAEDDQQKDNYQLALDVITEEDRETEAESVEVCQGETRESFHTTTITITDEVTTIRSSAAAADLTIPSAERSKETEPMRPAGDSVHVLNISLVSESKPDTENYKSGQQTSESARQDEEETQESSLIYVEHDTSEEDVDVILPPKETAEASFRESWEEVVTYQYEFDKNTGEKKIILRPKIFANEKTEYFSPIDSSFSSPTRKAERKKKLSDLPETGPDSVVVYEYGEMISLYSDTSVSDIYLNNSLELGSAGAEGAYAGIERAVDIMVSQQMKKAISEVTGAPLDGRPEAGAEGRRSAAASREDEEPLPTAAAAAAASVGCLPTDIEIDIGQMTPNLKRAVELLRNKYNIVKSSREATPIPAELRDAGQAPEAAIGLNTEPLPADTPTRPDIDEEIMEEVQEELETVMIELNKMDLAQAAVATSQKRSEAAHSGSESSDTDTLVESAPKANSEGQGDGLDTDEDESGENMIFDMDDVFVKVVTTKDGRIKKIKILEGKEGGDTKKIRSPSAETPPADDDGNEAEPTRLTDERYFTKMFYQEQFLGGDDDQYESDDDDNKDDGKRGEPRADVVTKAQHVMQHATRDPASPRRSAEHPGSQPETGPPCYDYYEDRTIPDDHSTDSETSDDDQEGEEGDDDDDDDEEEEEEEEYLDEDDEDDERESPMRSLSPIAEECDGQETSDSLPLPPLDKRPEISDSSEEEDSSDYVHIQRATPVERQHSESDEDLEILREFVRDQEASPSDESAGNSRGVSPLVVRPEEAAKPAVSPKQNLSPPGVSTDGSSRSEASSSTTATTGASDAASAESRTSTSEPTSSDTDVDSEGDILTQKLAVEGLLSSIGLAIFLVLAAIIIHFIRKYIEEDV